MPRIIWDADGERYYESGVSNVVLFTKTGMGGTYAKGVGWNGITAVNENPSGGDANAIYADNIKYLNLMSDEEFAFDIEAYMWPDEFNICQGVLESSTGSGVYIGQQKRKEFGLCYRTEIGNDEDGLDKGYKIHFIWNALAAPSSKSHGTITESPEAVSFSWSCTTTPIDVNTAGTFHKMAHLYIDSRTADATKLTSLLNTVYGTDGESGATGTDPTLPTPAQVIAAMTSGVSG